MISAAHAGTSRSLLLARLAEARRRTDALLDLIPPGRMLERPIAERHRFVFYLGHLEAFDWNLLSPRFDGARAASELDTLFAFGIDPVDGETPNEAPSAWPDLATIRAYNRDIRHALDASLPRALDAERFGEHFGDETPMATLIDAAIEHRLMHAETLAYMINQSSIARCVRGTKPVPVPAPDLELVRIPAGTATLSGTTTRQRTFTSTLAGIAADLKAARVLPSPVSAPVDPATPVIAVVGEQVAVVFAVRRQQWAEDDPDDGLDLGHVLERGRPGGV